MTDIYGFSQFNSDSKNNKNKNCFDYTKDIKKYNNNSITSSMYTNNSLINKLLSFFYFSYIFMAVIAVYLAWETSKNDRLWVKLVKIYIAIVFAPFYLCYYFFKYLIFN